MDQLDAPLDYVSPATPIYDSLADKFPEIPTVVIVPLTKRQRSHGHRDANRVLANAGFNVPTRGVVR